AGDQHIGRHDVAEGEIERAERRIVVLVGYGGVAVGHHDRLEIEHHGVARGRFAAHVGDGAGDEDGVDPALAQDFGKVRGALNERAETVFLDDEILRAYLERGPEL